MEKQRESKKTWAKPRIESLGTIAGLTQSGKSQAGFDFMAGSGSGK